MWRLFLAAGRLREAMRWDAVHVSTRCTRPAMMMSRGCRSERSRRRRVRISRAETTRPRSKDGGACPDLLKRAGHAIGELDAARMDGRIWLSF